MEPMRRAACLVLTASALGADPGVEFFEKRIRPVLVEKCYQCHNSKLAPPMGNLRLDTAAGLRKGGDSGPPVVPADPARSLLLRAISYLDLRLKMPPTGKLSDEQIEDFRKWIEMGAPDPRGERPAEAAGRKPGIDLEASRKFWAFQPVRRPEVPVRDTSWVRSPVDAFLLAKLEEKGLRPAPPADKRTWLRRVTFDLTGLPPAIEEIQDYLADTSPQAERRVVDRLLASPHYGERWARHWLDLVRFAETNGHEFDNNKLDAWRYRDYVIRAFQQDVPYQQFVREHIAGDLLRNQRVTPDSTVMESPLGAGVFWFGEVLNSATDSVKSRADTVDNQLDVLSKTFLGLTVACARCHDHKFDPLPTRDYYSLAGILHSTDIREAVIDAPERAQAIAARHARIGELNREIRSLWKASPKQAPRLELREGDTLFEDFEGPGYDGWTVSGQAFGTAPARDLPPNQPLAGYRGEAMASSFGAGTNLLVGSLTSKKFRLPKLWVHIRMAGTAEKGPKETADLRVTLVADDHKSQHFLPSGKPGWEWKTIRMTKEIGRICYFEVVDRSRAGHIAVDKIVISDLEKPPAGPEETGGPVRLEDLAADLPPAERERLEQLQRRRAEIEAGFPESAFGMISRDEAAGNVRVHIRGNHTNLGEEAPRQFLRVIAGDDQAPVREGSGRLELAEWMASERNPLTARVMVNRIWKHHFGHGLVRTTDNFGQTGERPTHPELLDYLASEFVVSGWSVKAMHRLMLLSSAYGMSGQAAEQAASMDPRNDLRHHMAPRRLEAEAIRDSILAVSGKLNPALYGPSVMPHISKYQDGRGKPASGPLDGNGRRSIYVQVRRNFLTPMFLAFDYPLPASTIGARSVSTVPSQALLMMNNELVAESAAAWARRVVSAPGEAPGRIDTLYQQAYGRLPQDWEKRETLAFLESQKDRPVEQAWTALCHVLLNAAEFVYVR